MLKQLSRFISSILNPFVVILIVLVSAEASVSILGAIKWSSILTLVNLLPIFLLVVHLMGRNRINGILSSTREQRGNVYLLCIILASLSYIIVYLLAAPSLVLALCLAGLSGSIVFSCVNVKWKISLHTAVITAMVTLLFILYGLVATISLVLIPLTAWSRINLREHALSEVIAGAVLGNIILTMAFSFYGRI